MTRSEERLLGHILEDRYRLDDVIGVGGMATVYEATHLRLDKSVAVKVLHPTLASDPRQRQRFVREAKAAARIESDHVVEISDFGNSEVAFVVMERLRGEDLAHTLRSSGPLPWARAQNIALQTLDALRSAHAIGVVHRDIKPSNIFLVQRGNADYVKVVDFGIAKVLDGVLADGIGTMTNEMLGSASYMAPEQIIGREVDARSDIYSVGVTLFQMLTGERPYRGSTAYQVMHQHMRGDPPHLPTNLAIPSFVDAVIQRAMAKNPKERYPDTTTMSAALSVAGAPVTPRLMPSLSLGMSEVPRPEPEPKLSRRQKLRLESLASQANEEELDESETQSNAPKPPNDPWAAAPDLTPHPQERPLEFAGSDTDAPPPSRPHNQLEPRAGSFASKSNKLSAPTIRVQGLSPVVAKPTHEPESSPEDSAGTSGRETEAPHEGGTVVVTPLEVSTSTSASSEPEAPFEGGTVVAPAQPAQEAMAQIGTVDPSALNYDDIEERPTEFFRPGGERHFDGSETYASDDDSVWTPRQHRWLPIAIVGIVGLTIIAWFFLGG